MKIPYVFDFLTTTYIFGLEYFFKYRRTPQFYPIWIIASAATEISLATWNAVKTEKRARALCPSHVFAAACQAAARGFWPAVTQRSSFCRGGKKSTKPLRAQSEYRFVASRFRAGRCHTRRRGATRSTRTSRAVAAARLVCRAIRNFH